MGLIVGAVVVVVLGGGGAWLLTQPVAAPKVVGAAAAPANAADPDGFLEATDGQVKAYEADLAALGLGEAFSAGAAAANVDEARQKVGASQVLVGQYRRKTADHLRDARLNANRRAGGGPEGKAAIAAFDAAHADALKLNSRRWELEAKVAEERAYVAQTLMVMDGHFHVAGDNVVADFPGDRQRLASDMAQVRAAEARLKAFKADPSLDGGPPTQARLK